ncbi:MAG: coproporphyrinogen dehydrogenase HemZ [Veillonella sp.]|uniref:coproporphyrinogen dehydrogenase HemZ n=1 Tax=Veillonella sp. TaxID=1926307 RepID=UPI0025F5D201|nr:coproporphyrinogen dehydrogenase HemZ [Veillonella sp.]MBS4913999.1 coproporphyrinogen dehydrogenase HemZ [Veillonella sp.]
MYNFYTYSYEGPLPLGSVVAHHCGAAGLVTAKEAHWQLSAVEGPSGYTLEVRVDGRVKQTFEGSVSTQGRTAIGAALLRYLRSEQGLDPVGEWGSLVGVRPTKLFHKRWDMTGSAEQAVESIRRDYEVSDGKLALLKKVATLQRPYVGATPDEARHISVYGGIPFCQTRCTYCSFPFGLIQDYKRVADFVEAFRADSLQLADLVRRYNLHVDSLYMGGGTPTSLDDEAFRNVLSAFKELHQPGREFTVEAGRPDSVTPDKLEAMKEHGVNRISINPQSMQDHILKAIARGHKADDIRRLYDQVKEQTDFIVNMDFIAGLPEQNFGHMQENLDYVCQARPENVTIHTLALKRGSPLYDSGRTDTMPEEDVVKDMVAYSRERLEAAGYVPYYVYRQQYMRGQLENIGYTLPGYACEYNIRIMEERQSILSVGPGSSSKWIGGAEYRQKKQHLPKDVSVYIDTLETLLRKRSLLSKQHWEG